MIMMNSVLDKIKKVNFKQVLKSFTLIWGLVLIIVMTITNVGIKQEFDFFQWLTNSLILFGIMVFGLLMGESIGDDRQREKVGGLYQKSLSEYNEMRKMVDDKVIYFNQFFAWFLTNELRNKKINYLVAHNIEMRKAELIVDYVNNDNYAESLDHAIKIIDNNNNERIIRKISEQEKEFVDMVIKGKITIETNSPNYYLSAFARSTQRTILETGKQLDRDIKYNKKSNRTIKIVFSLTVSLLMSVLTVNEMMSGEDAQAWANLISRITALFTSLFSGWLSSVIDVKLKALKILNKKDILSIFNNSIKEKVFVPKTEQELAQEEYEKYEKEQEQAKANIVEPEIIDDNTTKLLSLNEKE